MARSVKPLRPGKRLIVLWFSLSLFVSLYFGILSLLHLLNYPYIVQDDARQHVVFLQRLIDPQLFPNDLIAEYFTTIAPVGYKTLYGVGAKLGIAPITLAKFLPIVLSLVASAYLFFVSLEILAVPFSGFLATLILNQQLWLNDDLLSATPRAFVYPIFTAFLYYLLKRSLVPCLTTIGLQGLFFPQLVFVQATILLLRLLRWNFAPFADSREPSQLVRKQPFRFSLKQLLQRSDSKQDYIFAFWGVLMAGLVLVPYAVSVTEFGAAITVEQMQTMPEYGLHGRNEYFVEGWRFWLLGNSGIRIPIFPSIILAGTALPFLRQKLPLIAVVTDNVKIFGQVLLASLIMYGLAHLFLLKLHFPSRYTYHTLRIILAIAAALVLSALIDAGWRWLRYKQRIHSRLTIRDQGLLALTATFAAIVIIVPAMPQLFLRFQGWVVGEAPLVYQYLAAQPRNTLVASLAQDGNNLPAFAQRSTLVGREFALPHHPVYYAQFKQRVIDLIRAQYSLELTTLSRFIDQYNIDFFLIDQNSFTPNYLYQDWLIHSSFRDVVHQVTQKLKQGSQPVMLRAIEQCSVITTETLALIDAPCVKNDLSTQMSTQISVQNSDIAILTHH
jgi:hypothetical protein